MKNTPAVKCSTGYSLCLNLDTDDTGKPILLPELVIVLLQSEGRRKAIITVKSCPFISRQNRNGSAMPFISRQNRSSSAMPFISHQNIHFVNPIQNWLVTYFMSGVRPIELTVQFVLSEQAHTYKLYNQFCMAELFTHFAKKGFSLTGNWCIMNPKVKITGDHLIILY